MPPFPVAGFMEMRSQARVESHSGCPSRPSARHCKGTGGRQGRWSPRRRHSRLTWML
ncbi:MAG: hypothetical protein MZV64_34930 [Ignavibacteriales bacterium]|nr:hypothetical protein [Ignavibacteriales bacterium]